MPTEIQKIMKRRVVTDIAESHLRKVSDYTKKKMTGKSTMERMKCFMELLNKKKENPRIRALSKDELIKNIFPHVIDEINRLKKNYDLYVLFTSNYKFIEKYQDDINGQFLHKKKSSELIDLISCFLKSFICKELKALMSPIKK